MHMKDLSMKLGQDILASTALFDVVKDPVFLMEEDNGSFRYLYVNPSALAIMPTQDLIGKRLEDVLDAELCQMIISHHYEAIAARESVEFLEKADTKKGVFFGETVLNPIFSEDGQCRHIISIIRNVTEREYKKQDLQATQKQIEIERKRLDSIVENNANAVFEFDEQKKFLRINKKVTEVTGLTEEELIGQSVVSMVVESCLEDTLRHFDAALQGHAFDFETAIYNKGGDIVNFYVNTIPIVVDEEVIGVYIIAKDVTEQKKVVNLLQESEQRYKSLYANHPHGIFTFDRHGLIESINAGAETITGYSIDELKAGCFETALLPKEMDKVKRFFYKTVKTNKPQRYELSFLHKDGQIIDLQAMNIPIIVDGKLVGIHGIATDITEVKHAYNALNETKENLEVFWNNSADPIFFIDTKGDIVRVNPAFEKTFGFTEEEMLSGKATIIPPHMLEDQLAIVERISQGETVNSHDTIRITKSGKSLNIISSYSPVRNAEKEIVGATIIYKNVTELKKAEIELQKSQKKYKLITESTFDIITLVDLSGQIEYVSPAYERVSGFDNDSFIGKSFTTNVHPDDQSLLLSTVNSVIKGGKPATIEVRFLNQEGHYIWMEVSPTPVIEDGKVKKFFTIARDITERRKLQDKIAKMAFYDHLTAIPNRRTFDDQLEKALLEAKQSGKKAAIMLLDGRKFKEINDRYGHDAGDAVIIEMAMRLQNAMGPGQTAARLGGDEMGVILPAIDSEKTAEEMAQRILQSFEAPLSYNGVDIQIGAGIGIAIYPDNAVTEKQLIKRADMALYEAKKSDRNEHRFYQ
ncbi:putative diguanylate cyclase YegE [Planococcus massiliensis]|uniref:Putative diguanylate cyclase YegE n=2 Tax=Planococcus massiliensis TaxID=1499687 RepID=A0A098EGG2_9BACL|nr:putative diguanylate cyclase YegE [Planococcus massiliensis]